MPSVSAAPPFLARARSVYQRTTGAVLSPMSAFLLLQGIETVALRVERHVENARAVAEFLRGDPRVDWVNYAGFPDSPYYALAQKYLGGRASSLLTFGVKGGFEAGKNFYDALRLIKRLVNIGDAKSLACHPASTTHRQMPEAEQRKAGVTPETIRLSIGIEHRDDIIADLDQALAAAMRGANVAGGAMSRGRTIPAGRRPQPRRHPCRAGQQHARCGAARHRTAIRPAAQGRRGVAGCAAAAFLLALHRARRRGALAHGRFL